MSQKRPSLLKNCLGRWFRAFTGLERPDFSMKSCADLGVEADPSLTPAADLPFFNTLERFCNKRRAGRGGPSGSLAGVDRDSAARRGGHGSMCPRRVLGLPQPAPTGPGAPPAGYGEGVAVAPTGANR
jgi:hypothetical protein